MARKKVPGVKKSRLQQLSNARTSRLENRKRRKLDQPTEPPSPHNTELSDSDRDSELGWYWHDSSDSSDNGCSYREGVSYGSSDWQSKTSHQKMYSKLEDC